MAGGGQQGASAPAQGQMGQGYALGGQIGAPGPFVGQTQQAQSNTLGAISAPAGGGQPNTMNQMQEPPQIRTSMPLLPAGPYGGFNAQGQDAVNTAQTNYNQSGGQGQLTQAQQAAIAYNADPQGQPAPQWMSDIAYAQNAPNIYGGGVNPQAPQFQTNRMQPVPIPQLPFSEPPPPLTAAPAAPSSYRIDPMILMADANGQEIKHDDQRFKDYMNRVYSTPAPYQGSQTPAAPTNYINSNAAPPGPPPDIMQYGAPPPPQGMPPQGMPPQGMPPQFQPQARQPLQVKKNMNIAAPQRHNIQVLGNPTATQYVPRGRRGVR